MDIHLKKFKITFYFKTCSATVVVMADSEEEAIFTARDRQFPPVPDDIKTVAVYAGSGGSRPGTGNKKGSTRTDDPRTVKKQICWTVNEWKQITDAAKVTGLDLATYQRDLILNPTPEQPERET